MVSGDLLTQPVSEKTHSQPRAQLDKGLITNGPNRNKTKLELELTELFLMSMCALQISQNDARRLKRSPCVEVVGCPHCQLPTANCQLVFAQHFNLRGW